MTLPFLTHIFPFFCTSVKHFARSGRQQKSGTQCTSNQFRSELHRVSHTVEVHIWDDSAVKVRNFILNNYEIKWQQKKFFQNFISYILVCALKHEYLYILYL